VTSSFIWLVTKEKYLKMIKKLFDKLEDSQVVCTVVCLKKVVAINSDKGLSWDNDGFRGRDDGGFLNGILVPLVLSSEH
jgi:hypothetical protein